MGAPPSEKLKNIQKIEYELKEHYVGSGPKVLSQLTRCVNDWDAARGLGPLGTCDDHDIHQIGSRLQVLPSQLTR